MDLDTLSFPELNALRLDLVHALMRTSADLDAFERLRVRSTLAHEVARNTHLDDVPALATHEVYAGPLHQGLDVARLAPDAAGRARHNLVVASPLWGLLRVDDRIPPYRMSLMSGLLGFDRIDHEWRRLLPAALARAAGPAGPIVDLRSPGHVAMGRAAGMDERVVMLRVDQGTPGNRLGDVVAKRVRGEAAHHLLASTSEPRDPDDVAQILSERWPVQLASGEIRSARWTLTLSVRG